MRLLSSRNNTFNRDYHAEAPNGEQLPVLNVFSRDEDGIRHHWASEMMFKRGDTSSLDPVWAIYGVLDLTREGARRQRCLPQSVVLGAPRMSPVSVHGGPCNRVAGTRDPAWLSAAKSNGAAIRAARVLKQMPAPRSSSNASVSPPRGETFAVTLMLWCGRKLHAKR